MNALLHFLTVAETDARITTAHISVYVSLWKKWMDSGQNGPLSFFRQEITGICKISGSTTFHKVLRDLDRFGYLKYIPSYNHFLGSMVRFINSETRDNGITKCNNGSYT